jgi:hypothetical protein
VVMTKTPISIFAPAPVTRPLNAIQFGSLALCSFVFDSIPSSDDFVKSNPANDSVVLRSLERRHHSVDVLNSVDLELIPLLAVGSLGVGWRTYPRLAMSVAFGVHDRVSLRKSALAAIGEDERWTHSIMHHARRRRWGGPRSPELTAEAKLWLCSTEEKVLRGVMTVSEFEQVTFARDPERLVRVMLADNVNLSEACVNELVSWNDDVIVSKLLNNPSVQESMKKVLRSRASARYN